MSSAAPNRARHDTHEWRELCLHCGVDYEVPGHGHGNPLLHACPGMRIPWMDLNKRGYVTNNGLTAVRRIIDEYDRRWFVQEKQRRMGPEFEELRRYRKPWKPKAWLQAEPFVGPRLETRPLSFRSTVSEARPGRGTVVSWDIESAEPIDPLLRAFDVLDALEGPRKLWKDDPLPLILVGDLLWLTLEDLEELLGRRSASDVRGWLYAHSLRLTPSARPSRVCIDAVLNPWLDYLTTVLRLVGPKHLSTRNCGPDGLSRLAEFEEDTLLQVMSRSVPFSVGQAIARGATPKEQCYAFIDRRACGDGRLRRAFEAVEADLLTVDGKEGS